MSTITALIVCKNEERTIARSVASSVGICDRCLVVVDADTSDATEARATAAGALVVVGCSAKGDIAKARNDAVARAAAAGDGVRTDYVLMLDADDVLRASEPPPYDLVLDAYELDILDGDLRYARKCLFRPEVGFRYEGAAHEVLVDPDGRATTSARFSPIQYIRKTGDEGGSESGKRAEQTARKLGEFLVDNPLDPRALFYCAWAHKECRRYAEALRLYQKRVLVPGWDEETFYAQMQTGEVLWHMGQDPIGAYLEAWELRPTRAEPLYWAARYCRENRRFHSGLMIASRGLGIAEPPGDRLFVDQDVYRWKLLAEHGICAHYAGQPKVARRSLARVIERVPPEQLAWARENLRLAGGEPKGDGHG